MMLGRNQRQRKALPLMMCSDSQAVKTERLKMELNAQDDSPEYNLVRLGNTVDLSALVTPAHGF